MKAILEFNFANKGSSYYFILWEMDQWYRSKIKYDETLSDEQYKIYEESRQQLRDFIHDNRVTFND